MARSESNLVKLGGTGTYPDLNMTHYPDKIDTRVAGNGFNANLKGFENRKDYNLAEHINALGDAVMAVQRVLGVTPYMDKDGVNKGTVSARITTLENVDLDPRYGGVGWNTTQTLVGHTHKGVPGGPSKISLTTEVAGQLPKANINLTYNNANGLTGSDIAVSKEQNTTIDKSINDKLSTSQGGTIAKNLTVKGRTVSRFYLDVDSTQTTGGSLTADYSTRLGQSATFANPAGSNERFLSYADSNLQYGKYVACIRVKTTDNTSSEPLFQIHVSNQMGATNRWVTKGTKIVRGIDFDTSNQWQTFYFVFDHSSDQQTNFLHLIGTRFKTVTNSNLIFDYIHICPAHPAVYDN